MTILAGEFSIMLVLTAPATCDAAAIEAALAPVAASLDLLVAVRPTGEVATAADEGEMLAVSVHGADHPGIVARFAREIAAAGGNIVDLATRVVADPLRPSYVMVLSVVLQGDAGALAERLSAVAAQAGVHCTVSAADAELL